MEQIRREIMSGVYLNYTRSDKFKTNLLSVQLITPLAAETAAQGALLPAVLSRGTAAHPDMKSLSGALDRLYGASIGYTVRKKGENQCLGFVASYIDERFVPGGERLLEPVCELLHEMLLEPRTRGGRFLSEFTEGEKVNLCDAIRGILNDKRGYADMRLLEEMCKGERYGVCKLGTVERVEKITNQTLYLFYRELLPSAHLEVFYCGSAELPRLEQAVRQALASLPRAQVTSPVTAAHAGAPDAPRFVTEALDVTQGKLSMGWRVTTEDVPAMLLANLIFGGYSNSRLFLNVREKLSLCYYAASSYHRSKGIVTVSSGIECANYQTAYDEILSQLAAVQRGELAPWELDGARACLVSSLRQREDSAGRMEENFIGQAATGLWETEEELIAALSTVTAERIAAAAQTMQPDTVYFLTGKGEIADE